MKWYVNSDKFVSTDNEMSMQFYMKLSTLLMYFVHELNFQYCINNPIGLAFVCILLVDWFVLCNIDMFY